MWNNDRGAAPTFGASAAATGQVVGSRSDWTNYLIAGATFCITGAGIFLPAWTIFENCAATPPSIASKLFNASSYTRRLAKVWQPREIPFGFTPLRNLWEDTGVMYLIKSWLWSQGNDFGRVFLTQQFNGAALQFYDGYYRSRYGFQPAITPQMSNLFYQISSAVSSYLIYPLDIMCFRFRHNLPTEFKLSYYLSPSVIPYLAVNYVGGVLHGIIYQRLFFSLWPMVTPFMSDPSTGQSTTPRDRRIAKLFATGVMTLELVISSVALLPLVVVSVKALALECAVGGPSNPLQVVQEIWSGEGIRGFYRGWGWFLLSSLEKFLTVPLLTTA